TPTAKAPACAQTLCRLHPKAALRRLGARQRPAPTGPCLSATAYHHNARATTPGRHLHLLLPPPGLCLSGLGGLGPSPRQRPSERGALAPTARRRVSSRLSGDLWHALARQADSA